MTVCSDCGSNASLRFDRLLNAWVCYHGCGHQPTRERNAVRAKPKKAWKREPLFNAYWTDLAGNRLERATKEELKEAYRLWTVHKDIREGRTR